ncbi:ras-like protein family member 12 [Xenopus laevis]|uniref:small monomeric GTPase n=1 Tax=Xenopus laevis TaxID=8355 RepID=A0A8J1MM70_XENLA|nr:ras-like protein family member 12 [Xenopus laevis]XP_041442821.1 ras-like protein family member 12 [Xenopus laevis]XP_041442822.1 ras-like protein family member 12 [Xenopus laevis]
MSLMFGKPRALNVVNISGANERNVHLECNIVLLGCRGAGKSALTVKFLTRRFISEYDPFLEDTYTSEEVVDQQTVLVRVMDTADQNGPVNPERYLHWANAFLVVYSIDNKKSFEGCCQYLDIISQYNRGALHENLVLLLGNKLDMERYRQVSKADGSALASRHGCLFREVSACLDFRLVQQVFHEAIQEARREAERAALIKPPIYISEERALGLPNNSSPGTATRPPLSTLSPLTYKEIPSVAQAKLVTVKSSRAQSKRKAPTLTLLKGFKIF